MNFPVICFTSFLYSACQGTSTAFNTVIHNTRGKNRIHTTRERNRIHIAREGNRMHRFNCTHTHHNPRTATTETQSEEQPATAERQLSTTAFVYSPALAFSDDATSFITTALSSRRCCVAPPLLWLRASCARDFAESERVCFEQNPVVSVSLSVPGREGEADA
ncbi:hypothetical protein ISCGN_024630 [Ixodes scapularis]